ncbi:MAG: FGGY-family carbohydrate kinase [Chloroflexota bacterium]|nr:FGGY-family carbohydrate kinase [Chloroflexota bacterium]
MFVLGIDIGTQGARALIASLDGEVLSEAHIDFPPSQIAPSETGRFEQDPHLWRKTALDVISAAVHGFREAGRDPQKIAALSVTSTSGTLCLVDEAGDPVGPAIMYSDTRAEEEAQEVQAAGAKLAQKLGTRFSPSFALSRLRWLQHHHPERLARARWFASPTDLVIGWLSGEWGHSDWTNMLKWGYDVADLQWPAFIEEDLDLPMNKFPAVQAPGNVVGGITPAIGAETGLSTKTVVVSGATDGTASLLASGAAAPGDWNSTLGTTLVLKGVSESLLRDPLGRIYCHRHPDGYWLPGGASSTGADCLVQRFDAERLSQLNAGARRHTPTDLLIYPLMRRGERFPFQKPEATGFILGETEDEGVYFAAHLEGLAYVERLAYEVVQDLGASVGDTVYTAGGGTQSATGLQIRADVMQKSLQVPETPAGAMGAAILAARAAGYDSVLEATKEMVHYRQTVEPRCSLAPAYEERYRRFIQACRERGYLT